MKRELEKHLYVNEQTSSSDRTRYVNPFVSTVPTFAVRETQSLGQQMLELGCENATVGTNGLNTASMIVFTIFIRLRSLIFPEFLLRSLNQT